MITDQEYQRGEEVYFIKDGKKVKGTIKDFLTKQEAKECLMWYSPLIVEVKNETSIETIELADYELLP